MSERLTQVNVQRTKQALDLARDVVKDIIHVHCLRTAGLRRRAWAYDSAEGNDDDSEGAVVSAL